MDKKSSRPPLWKLQNWTSIYKRSQVITENSRLQKEQQNALSKLLITEKTLHYAPNELSPPPWNHPWFLSFITHLCRYKWAKTLKEMWLFTSWNHCLRLFICLSTLSQLWHNCQEKLCQTVTNKLYTLWNILPHHNVPHVRYSRHAKDLNSAITLYIYDKAVPKRNHMSNANWKLRQRLTARPHCYLTVHKTARCKVLTVHPST